MPDLQNTSIAVLVPIDQEFSPYRHLFSELRRIESRSPWEMYETVLEKQRIVFMLSDCGPANAAAAVERVIAEFNPSAIIHAGAAGAINQDLLPGDIVIGSRYVILAPKETTDSRLARGFNPSLMRYRKNGRRVYLDSVQADEHLLCLANELAGVEFPLISGWNGSSLPAGTRTRSRTVIGIIGSADTWTTNPHELSRLRTEYGIECEDMESAYMALISNLHEVPFLAIRAISDNEVLHQLDAKDVMQALASAGEIASQVVLLLLKKLCADQRSII